MRNLSSRTQIQLGLIAILAIFALSLILSQKAAPNIPLFFSLKRVQEKVYLNLKSSPEQKVNYMIFLLNNRLYELDAVVRAKNYQYVLPSSSRYSTLAGQITDLVLANNMTDKVDLVRQTFQAHYPILVDLYVLYPKNDPENNHEWKYIQDDYNYLKIYLDKLSSL